MSFRSAVYQGRVRHTRLRPVHHNFEYRVFYALLDIDELDALDERVRLFSLSRFNLISFDPADHGPGDGSSLRRWAETIMVRAGVGVPGGNIDLLAIPRVLGYVFNPISVWYCYHPDGRLSTLLYEVRNTFGDRHVYVVGPDPGTSHAVEKEMHVSPFNDLRQSYVFNLGFPGERLRLSIEQSDPDGVFFRAGLRLSRVPFDDRNLLRVFLTHPLSTIRVISGIHWQALRLWLKGATYHPHPPPPENDISIINTSVVAV